MKRSMDLVRSLLLKLEGLDVRPGRILSFSPGAPEIAVAGFDADAISYHYQLLREAGLIDTTDSPGSLNGDLYFCALTWKGHDFLDAVREPKAWHRTKEGAEKAGAWTADILLGMAKAYAKAEIKAKLGIDL